MKRQAIASVRDSQGAMCLDGCAKQSSKIWPHIRLSVFQKGHQILNDPNKLKLSRSTTAPSQDTEIEHPIGQKSRFFAGFRQFLGHNSAITHQSPIKFESHTAAAPQWPINNMGFPKAPKGASNISVTNISAWSVHGARTSRISNRQTGIGFYILIMSP